MAYWASDPGWTPPADGGAVASWADYSGNARTASQATGAAQPLFRASSANFSNRPCIEFDGTDDLLVTAVGTSLAQPNEIVLVARLLSKAAGPATRQIFDGAVSTARHTFSVAPAVSDWSLFGGTATLSGGTDDLDTHHFRLIFNNNASSLTLDGTTAVFGATAIGTHALTGISIGNRYDGTRPANLQIAFLGVSDAALTPTERTDLLAWSQSAYGTP